jgi:hypothetical protein
VRATDEAVPQALSGYRPRISMSASAGEAMAACGSGAQAPAARTSRGIANAVVRFRILLIPLQLVHMPDLAPCRHLSGSALVVPAEAGIHRSQGLLRHLPRHMDPSFRWDDGLVALSLG